MTSRFEASLKRWTSAYNQKDVDALALLYTDHAVIYSAEGNVIRGREAIRGFFEHRFEEFDAALPGTAVRFESSVEDEKAFGTVGYQFGSYRITAPDGRVVMQGHYAGIARQLGDEWKIARHMMTGTVITSPVAIEAPRKALASA